MATEAARLKRQKALIRKRKTVLTLTGLLMEGLGEVDAAYFTQLATHECIRRSTFGWTSFRILGHLGR